MKFKLTVLGSGTSSGVPVIACDCAVCKSTNPKNNRLRTSCLIEIDKHNILIDTGPDLRLQALKFNIRHVDAVLYTHMHADHFLGIDELRIFNAIQKSKISIYGKENHIIILTNMFRYIFNPTINYPSLTPKLEPNVIDGYFEVDGIPVQMFECEHGHAGSTANYRLGNVAWIPDTNGVPDDSLQYLKGLDYLFIDGLRFKKHPTHFSLEEAIAAAQKIGAKQTYLIHLAHDYDHDVVNATLPQGIALAYDGLQIESTLS